MLKFRQFILENPERARRLLHSLKHVTIERGATQGEHDSARRREQEIKAKYNMNHESGNWKQKESGTGHIYTHTKNPHHVIRAGKLKSGDLHWVHYDYSKPEHSEVVNRGKSEDSLKKHMEEVI